MPKAAQVGIRVHGLVAFFQVRKRLPRPDTARRRFPGHQLRMLFEGVLAAREKPQLQCTRLVQTSVTVYQTCEHKFSYNGRTTTHLHLCQAHHSAGLLEWCIELEAARMCKARMQANMCSLALVTSGLTGANMQANAADNCLLI